MKFSSTAIFLTLFTFEVNSQRIKKGENIHGKANSIYQQTAHKISMQNRTVCKWKKTLSKTLIYWVNLEDSIRRRRYFERHLHETGFRGLRMHALTPSEYTLVIPCYTKTPREIACIISHLAAIYHAINDPTDDSQYVLILEDDVIFQFNIDLDALVATAPKGFGILQMVTSSEHHIRKFWEEYKVDGKLWIKRDWNDGYWSTQAFLVNKAVVRSSIEEVVKIDANGALSFHLMAPAKMKQRCLSGCVTPFCLAADTYLYNQLGPTYTAKIPYFNGALVGSNSTIHQKNVNSHSKAFMQIDSVVDEARSGKVKLPPFLSVPECFSAMMLVRK